MKTYKIGRNPDNDIVIGDENRTVSGYHAVLKVNDNGIITICDNSTNGTLVNGVKITKDLDMPVKKGDDIRFSKIASLDWSLVDVPASGGNDATVIDNGEKESYSIGTALDNQVIISDTGQHVSRHHATLKLKTDGKYYIYDQSTNGTFVNDMKIKPKVDFPVSISDKITLASYCQLDWNKIPNVSVPKASPYVAPKSANKGNDNYSNSTKNENGFWSYLLYAAVFIGVAYFSYYKTFKEDAVQSATKEVPIVQPTIQPTIQSASPVESTTPIIETKSTDISTLYEQNKDAVFVIYTSNGTEAAQGSGFFISPSGVAVSNYHVFKGTTPGLESIVTANGTFKVESVLKKSEENDFIVFKVSKIGSVFPFLKIANSLPRVGENVFAIGNPEGLENTLSTGIVSSYRGNNKAVIQTTAEITHGSSGGPLFNKQGEVIGITSAGMGDANLNFAINIVGLGFENN